MKGLGGRLQKDEDEDRQRGDLGDMKWRVLRVAGLGADKSGTALRLDEFRGRSGILVRSLGNAGHILDRSRRDLSEVSREIARAVLR